MEQKEYIPKCTCGEQISGICNGLGKCTVYPPKPYNSLEEALKIDLQKKTDALKSELPQEIVHLLSGYKFRGNEIKNAAFKGIAKIGAQIASEHYEPQLTALKEELERVKKQLSDATSMLNTQ